jgi:hypothetical protein
MPDDPVKFILGDTAISAVTEHPGSKRGFFGRKRRPPPPLTHCENCGEPLTGKYCSQCGQPAIDYRRSFRHVFVDILESFLSWDSKFFATITWLIVRPWHLTNEFLAGRRVRYVHPLRLYLLASILFFFAVNYWAKSIHLQSGNLSKEKRTEIANELKNEDLPPEARKKVEEALKLNSPTPAPSAGLDEGTEPKKSPGEVSKTKKATPVPHLKTEEASRKEGDRSDQDDFGQLLQFGPEKPSTSFEKWLKARAKEKIGEHGTNAQLFLTTVFNNLPYMMLCCIPLFAFVLKILYIRKGIFYIDHLVYALHIHSLAYLSIMTIVLATMGLFRSIPGVWAGWIVGLLWFVFAVQVFLSIRRVYRQGWFFSIFKFLVGGLVYFIVLCLALAATFFITLALP